MANYSVVISDRTHYGAIGDLSLSGNETALSYSVWLKAASGTDGLGVMGNNKSNTGTGGASILFDSLEQVEMMAENIAYQPAWKPVATDGVFGLITPATTWNNDGQWHNIVGTYSSNIIASTVTTVVDGTHLTVTTTTGMAPGDRIYFGFISTTITTVTDGTHLVVANTAGWSADRFVCGGVHIYLDGVEITTYADYEFTLFFNDFDCDIPFGIGDAEHLNYHSKLGKYAYPAVYHRILSPAEAATIASGQNITTGAVGQWLFTEGSGLTAADSSGNSRTLTFNAISWDTDVPFGNGASAKKKASSNLVF